MATSIGYFDKDSDDSDDSKSMYTVVENETSSILKDFF
jgi:hypothetical protein